ncbi:MAG: radical SAM protein [Endomicrobia bacterium]|nr:radical SAM protein [Endomicrobiia bacterium]
MNKTFPLQKQLFLYSYKKRIPLYSVVELTYKCNLNCIHCYIPQSYRSYKELTTKEIKNVIYSIYKLGGLYLVFSGGEPFLREDIFDLIDYAKSLNFVVVLFSNGTLITKKIAKKILKSKVDKVEISIYGDKSTHNKFVGKDVFDKVLTAICILKDFGINTAIKTVVTKENLNDFFKLRFISQKLNVELKTDFVISAKNNGDNSNLELMLEEKDLLKFFKENRLNFKNFSKKKNLKSLLCSAGFNLVCVSPKGDVYPCVAFPYALGNVKYNTFEDIWYNKNFIIKMVNKDNYKECFSCDLFRFCNRCPGMCFVETGSFYGCSKVLKRVSYVLSQI